jgi:hypothetical protein
MVDRDPIPGSAKLETLQKLVLLALVVVVIISVVGLYLFFLRKR